jgi:hypothetical protein
MIAAPLAFRVVGGAENRREVVSYHKATLAYAHADPAVYPELSAFLSAFSYPKALKVHVEATGSTAGYTGAVGIPFLNIDIDRNDLDTAIREARRLAAFLADRYHADPVVHFSGSKGFHVSVPTAGFVEPAPGNPGVAKALAGRLADEAGVGIDRGVYDRLRLWRAPNSRHRKSGLHKVIIDLDDLLYIDADGVRQRAAGPIEYDPPDPASPSGLLVEDWREAAKEVWRHRAEPPQPRQTAGGARGINPLTRQLITDPTSVNVGERHLTLFSAAANLGEFARDDDLIFALLTEPGLDTGLPPREVERQIRCGIDHARRQRGEGGAP